VGISPPSCREAPRGRRSCGEAAETLRDDDRGAPGRISCGSGAGYHCAGKVLVENRGVYCCLNVGGVQADDAIRRPSSPPSNRQRSASLGRPLPRARPARSLTANGGDGLGESQQLGDLLERRCGPVKKLLGFRSPESARLRAGADENQLGGYEGTLFGAQCPENVGSCPNLRPARRLRERELRSSRNRLERSSRFPPFNRLSAGCPAAAGPRASVRSRRRSAPRPRARLPLRSRSSPSRRSAALGP
jgi:hypothetical protein